MWIRKLDKFEYYMLINRKSSKYSNQTLRINTIVGIWPLINWWWYNLCVNTRIITKL